MTLLEHALKMNDDDPSSPLPVQQCGKCGNTIWKQVDWYQCPDCFALSTSYGGLFTHATGASKEFLDAVNKVRNGVKND